jgi:hypothetical protein
MTENPEDQKAKQQALVAQICKAGGAVFMLLAPVIGFNLGGVADWIGVQGPGTYICGAMLFAIGVFDFLILPVILSGKQKL